MARVRERNTLAGLDADATALLDCDDFAAWCDERREAWAESVEGEAAEH